MKAKYNEKLVEAFQKMSDEQKAEFYKPASATSYEEIQRRLKEMFCPSKPAPEKTTIEGWIAVDELYDSVFLHTHKPTIGSVPFADTGEYYSEWKSDGSTYLLDECLFPDMDCESEPKRVRIEITLIDDDNP